MTRKITILESSGDIAIPAGARLYYQGSWTEKPAPLGFIPVAIDFPGPESEPLRFRDHVIPQELVDQILAQGVVTQIEIEYPRADKYGAPLAVAGESFARALIGNLGLAVTPSDLRVLTKDRGDDGAETYVLTVSVPESVSESLLAL